LTEPLIITTSKRDDNQLDLTIQLGPQRTEEALQRGVRQVAKRARIPGFRPGKAPPATVLRLFGRDAVLGEVVEELGPEVYKEALESEHIEPYGQATWQDVHTDPLSFKLVVPMNPEVDLGDYRSIRIEAPELNVTDADVDQALEAAQEQHATSQPVDRPAQIGDTIVLDIHGAVGDETIMDNHDWELLIRGESGWLPGFDEAFVGMASGEEKAFTLPYPEDSASRFKGQEASFQVTVKGVRARVRPEADDEFAKSLGDYTDLADYRVKKLAELTEQRRVAAENKLNDDAIEALIERATLSYPPLALEETLDEMIDEVRRRVARLGYSMEDFLRLQGTTMDAYRVQLRPAAERRLKGRLVLSALAVEEGITVAPEDNQAELDRIIGNARDDEHAGNLRQAFQSEAGQWMIEQDLKTRRTLVRLREIVTGQAPELPASALEATEQGAETSADAEATAGQPVADQAGEPALMTETVVAEASDDQTVKSDEQ
jgi:trigger factor